MTDKNNKTTIIILSVAVIGLLAVIFFAINESANELSAETVAEKMVNYINENFMGPETKASLINFSDEGSVYKFRLSIEGMEFDSYASKDGMYLFPEGIDTREEMLLEEFQEPETPDLSDINPQEMADFINCLADADFRIYGANWCGWTSQLVGMFGGWDAVKPVYIECTEQEELCQEKEIMGYPTILVKGQDYQGSRTFDDFAKTTGCLAPMGSENQNSENPAGGC